MTDLIMLSGLTLVIIQALKTAVNGNYSRFYPLVAIVIGLVMSIGLNYQYQTITEGIVNGIIIGASSVGLWEAGKKSVLNK